MNCLVRDIKLYNSFITIINEDVDHLEKKNLRIHQVEHEKRLVEKKHAGLSFAFRALLFSLLSFIVLRMAYSVIPKDFNYVYLAPLCGIAIELVFMIIYRKKERKAILKDKKKTLASLYADQKEIEDGILLTSSFMDKKLRDITDKPCKYIDNPYCLEYILKKDTNDNTVIDFDRRYAEFECRYDRMNEYPELQELKEKIQAAQTQAKYASLTIKGIKEKQKDTVPEPGS